MFEDKLEIIGLIDTYGTMLSESRLDILLDYYISDISLGEIAENRGISRQAVHDSIAKSIKKLRDYESNMKIIDKQKKLKIFLEIMSKEDRISESDYNKMIEILEE